MSDYHHWLHADHKNVGKPLSAYLESTGILDEKLQDSTWADAWESAKNKGSVSEYLVDPDTKEWNQEKVEGYNQALSGKICDSATVSGNSRTSTKPRAASASRSS